MKFKYRWLVIRSVALIMVIYISAVALSMPIGAVVDTSRGEGDNFDITAASSFPMTVGFAFRSSSDSEYNYITATDIGGYGQEYNRTLTGTDEFTYTFDELNENATTTRYLHYTFGNIYWSSQSLFGYRYGFQPLTLSCDTLGTDEACETIVLRAPEVVFNTYVFDHYKGTGYTLADLAYLGIPVISAPHVVGPSESKYVGTCSIKYSVTDQHGNKKDFNYSVSYSSENNDYIPLLNVNDLYTYYNAIDPASDSPKILITDWYVYWDVDYYEFIDDISFTVDGESFTCPVGTTWSSFVADSSLNNGKFRNFDGDVQFAVGSDIWAPISTDGTAANIVDSSDVIQSLSYLTFLGDDLIEDDLAGTWGLNSSLALADLPFGVSYADYYVSGTITSKKNDNLVTYPLTMIRLFNASHTASMAVCLFTGVNGRLNFYFSERSGNVSNGYVECSQDFSTSFNVYPTDSVFTDVCTFTVDTILANVRPDNTSIGSEYLLQFLQANAIKVDTASVMTLSDEPVAAASGEWVKVDSDKRNIVQIGYPLYDTSSGDPDYAALLSYPDFDNFLKGSTIDIPTVPGYPGEPDEQVSSLTRWLGAAVSGFTDVELWEGFSIGGLLAIIVSFSVVMMFLKVFAGG